MTYIVGRRCQLIKSDEPASAGGHSDNHVPAMDRRDRTRDLWRVALHTTLNP